MNTSQESFRRFRHVVRSISCVYFPRTRKYLVGSSSYVNQKRTDNHSHDSLIRALLFNALKSLYEGISRMKSGVRSTGSHVTCRTHLCIVSSRGSHENIRAREFIARTFSHDSSLPVICVSGVLICYAGLEADPLGTRNRPPKRDQKKTSPFHI